MPYRKAEKENHNRREWQKEKETRKKKKIPRGPNERLNNKEEIDQERQRLEELAQRLVEEIKEKLIWELSNSMKIGAGYPNTPKLGATVVTKNIAIENKVKEPRVLESLPSETLTSVGKEKGLNISCLAFANDTTFIANTQIDENKENQPTIGRVATKRACFTNIVCYKSNSKGKSQAEERSSNRVLQEKLSNEVKRTQTEKLIDITLWVKYTKGEMNLELEPEHFINRSEGNSISLEKVRSLQSKKEKIKVMIEEPKIEIECSLREFIKQLLMTATRAEWTFNQGAYDEIHQKQAWAKKEEEILDSIREELKQKEKIDLGWTEILSIAKEEVYAWIEQGVNNMQKIHNYPVDSIIKFKQPNCRFLYIIKEAIYPNKPFLAYTYLPNKYQIPDDYTVETTWGRGDN
ncbi:42012_t:CDS:2 [Gigaspora margarita]|uniref:42012_t:CDS:1 n=1 Tax=Gigaspora margarita TaxID=4874 RepID=A0ABN7V0U7_GIGMA|nr:42012_t:CDS:2 [Gigaspora margarita]